MRPQKIDDNELMSRMLEVIRAKGYAGTSLNDLAEAAELKKASLYHRFPGGKEEIVLSVLKYTREFVDREILSLLKDEAKDPAKRLKLALKNITNYYDHGRKTCLSRALSTETGWPVLSELLKTSSTKWINAFKTVALHLGFKETEAARMGEDTLIRIQGSLLIARYLDSVEPFDRAIQNIEIAFLGD